MFNWTGTGSFATFTVQQAPCQRAHVPPGTVCVPLEFLEDVLKLAHPDLHDDSRKERAHKVCSAVTPVIKALRQMK